MLKALPKQSWISYLWIFTSFSRRKKFNEVFDFTNEKFKLIPDMMKSYLENQRDNAKLYEQIKEGFIQVLNDSKFTQMEVINSLNIKLSTKKWRMTKNGIPLKKRGKKPIDNEKLSDQIKLWSEAIAKDHIIRKTVQTVKRVKEKESIYLKENKLAVVCCYKCFYKEFIKDNFNKEYATISYVSFLRRLPKNIILPSKKTDLCELCLIGKKKENIQNPSEEEKILLLVYKNHLSQMLLHKGLVLKMIY